MKTKKRSRLTARQWLEEHIDMFAEAVYDPAPVDRFVKEQQEGLTTFESIRIHATERR